jgi:hypothetical protein
VRLNVDFEELIKVLWDGFRITKLLTDPTGTHSQNHLDKIFPHQRAPNSSLFPTLFSLDEAVLNFSSCQFMAWFLKILLGSSCSLYIIYCSPHLQPIDPRVFITEAHKMLLIDLDYIILLGYHLKYNFLIFSVSAVLVHTKYFIYFLLFLIKLYVGAIFPCLKNLFYTFFHSDNNWVFRE